jgi:hypothetical protein
MLPRRPTTLNAHSKSCSLPAKFRHPRNRMTDDKEDGDLDLRTTPRPFLHDRKRMLKWGPLSVLVLIALLTVVIYAWREIEAALNISQQVN